MKPPPFDLVRASGLDEAVAALREAGDEAKVLAGGQSLVPMMNLRLARPSVLVDVNGIAELALVERVGDTLRLGATVRQSRLLTDEHVRAAAPMLATAAAHIAHAAIRNRGTVGGSLSHADPTAELPAVALALDARLHVTGAGGERVVEATDFFLGPFQPALEPGEILTGVTLATPPGRRGAFGEVAERTGDFALAAVAVALTLRDGLVADPRVVACGAGPVPMRLAACEAALAGAAPGEPVLDRAAAVATDGLEPHDDAHAPAAYKRHLLRTLVLRTLREAVGGHGGGAA